MYNKVPTVIRDIEGYTPFVKALKIILVEKCCYKVDDYNKEIWQSCFNIIIFIYYLIVSDQAVFLLLQFYLST